MQWLVLIHVLSAIIGVGPTFFSHILVRKGQSIGELRHSMTTMKKLEYFPKIGGTIAVLTGLLLVIVGNYGSFTQMWLLGALILYILIQVIVIGFVAPLGKKLGETLFGPGTPADGALSAVQSGLLRQINARTYMATTLGTLLFIFMIAKP